MNRRARIAGASVCLALLALIACNEEVRSRIQDKIDEYWGTPAKKAELEDEAERALDRKLEEALVGREFEIRGPNPYVHSIKRVQVDIGQRQPLVAIPGEVEYWSTNSHHYFHFQWELDWDRGNGARVDFTLDLRSHHWWMFNEFPDHCVRIRDIDAFGHGEALAVVPRSGGEANASITLFGASIDLTAHARGWFWKIDIANRVKHELNENFIRKVVGKTVEAAFTSP